MANLDLWRRDRNMPRSLFEEMWSMFNDIDRNQSSSTSSQNERMSIPACDVTETEAGYVLTLDVPGLKKDDIHIETTGRQLTVSGERKREENIERESYHRVERSYGKFFRTFELPEGTNVEVIDASYDNGVLKIAVPKAESSKTRKVQISDGSKGLLKRITTRDKDENKAAHAS